MSKIKYTEEIKLKAIELRLQGKSSTEITAETGMKKESLNKLFKERGVYLTEEQVIIARARRWLNHDPIKNGTKYCSTCKLHLPLNEFHRAKNRLSGHTSSCKTCSSDLYKKNREEIINRVSIYRKNNKEKISIRSSRYYEENKEKIITRSYQWASKNTEKRKEIEKKFQKKYQPIKNSHTSKYRAVKKQAMPKWLSEKDIQQINSMYINCVSGYQVDHIIPLRGDNVSGLHVPWNLQYLPSFQNEVKSNTVQINTKVGICHQFQRKLDTMEEDISNGAPRDVDISKFVLNIEPYSQEHGKFIERYEWLGTVGYSPKWIFVARYCGLIGGVVILSEPNGYTKNIEIEALISRGATASWTPKNLGSKLIMFACRYMVKNTGKRVFFGYSDHSAGEIGTIYQACNFKYLGQNFGCRTMYKISNGKMVSSRYFRKTSTFKRYAREAGIYWQSSWTKKNKYMDIKTIPHEILLFLKEKGQKEMLECISETQLPKGKYVLFMGINKKEKTIISEKYDAIFGEYLPYPKRP